MSNIPPVYGFRPGKMKEQFDEEVEQRFNGNKSELIHAALKLYFSKLPSISAKNAKRLEGLAEFSGKTVDEVLTLIIDSYTSQNMFNNVKHNNE